MVHSRRAHCDQTGRAPLKGSVGDIVGKSLFAGRADVDVSIIMPCLNEARCLPACIANAREALDTMRQRYGLSGEIIIADNGSTDGSQVIAERLGARCVAVTRRGYGAALSGATKATRSPARVCISLRSWATAARHF